MRKILLATNEVYHIFNRGIERKSTFTNKYEYQRAMTALDFYRFENPPIRLAKAMELEIEQKKLFWSSLKSEHEKLVEIISYCLMPNHFHLLLKQLKENGIKIFLSNFSDSYTRYFNSKHDRFGILFQGIFKSVHIETDEQLLHVSRYIHINPATSFVVPEKDLINYPWSSLGEIIENKEGICDKQFILNYYKSMDEYKKFVFDQIDYGKKLEMIKHLTLE